MYFSSFRIHFFFRSFRFLRALLLLLLCILLFVCSVFFCAVVVAADAAFGAWWCFQCLSFHIFFSSLSSFSWEQRTAKGRTELL